MKQSVPFFPAQCLFAPALSVAVMVLYAPRVTVADDCVEFFEKKIHPVLVEHCYQCHSGESRRGPVYRRQFRADERICSLRSGYGSRRIEVTQ
jgi:hypothetical protein